MARISLGNSYFIKGLDGPIVVADNFVPRFWATIWSDVLNADLADATQMSNLAAIDKLYVSVENRPGTAKLDSIIASMDFDALEGVLGGFLTQLRNEGKIAAIDRDVIWQPVLKFIDDVMSHLSPTSDKHVADLSARLLRLQRLYSQLTPSRPKTPKPVRALPALVLEDLYEIFNPQSPRNPFRTETLKWRNYMIFIVLLHLGLRRGEILILPVDAINEDFDYASNRPVHWINVTETPEEYGPDPRTSKPSIKTAASHRQLPVSDEVLRVVDRYTANYRGKPSHQFLINSQQMQPLAKQSLADVFGAASSSLSDRALKLLAALEKTSVTPHDLRHTAAVIKLTKFRKSFLDLDTATEKLRVFFGWSPKSAMPQHYAKAYFETALADVWDDSFDSFVDVLRGISGVTQ